MIRYVLVLATVTVLAGCALSSRLPLEELEEELFQIFRRQNTIGLPCSHDKYFCSRVKGEVCCNGYCHYECDDEQDRKPLPSTSTTQNPNDQGQKITKEECQTFVTWRVCSWDCEVADALCAECKKLYNKELNWE